MNLHFSLVTLQKIKSLVKQDFLAVMLPRLHKTNMPRIEYLWSASVSWIRCDVSLEGKGGPVEIPSLSGEDVRGCDCVCTTPFISPQWTGRLEAEESSHTLQERKDVEVQLYGQNKGKQSRQRNEQESERSEENPVSLSAELGKTKPGDKARQENLETKGRLCCANRHGKAATASHSWKSNQKLSTQNQQRSYLLHLLGSFQATGVLALWSHLLPGVHRGLLDRSPGGRSRRHRLLPSVQEGVPRTKLQAQPHRCQHSGELLSGSGGERDWNPPGRCWGNREGSHSGPTLQQTQRGAEALLWGGPGAGVSGVWCLPGAQKSHHGVCPGGWTEVQGELCFN